jgi:hypothetical protein
MPLHLQGFETVRDRLLAAASCEYRYAYPFQRPINAAIDRIAKDGLLVKGSDGQYRPRQDFAGHITAPTALIAGMICNNGGTYQILGTLLVADRIAVAKFARTIRGGILADDLLIPFMCIRAILEHTAHLHKLLKDMRPVQQPSTFDEANAELARLLGLVGSRAYATRVDWSGLLHKDATTLSKDDVKYTPNELRLDRTAQGLMTAIDHLDKQVLGSRAAYEILCEFVHPNVGNHMTTVEALETFTDCMSVVWVRKRLGMNPPSEFLKSAADVVSGLFGHFVKLLGHYEQLLVEPAQVRESVLVVTQVVVRHLLAARTERFDPYWLCPCGSGKKLKFCCLANSSRSPPDAESSTTRGG